MDAKFYLLELNRKEVIPDSLVTEIKNADDGTAREILFKHLHCHADVATLREYCRITISKDGYPKMQALGKKMLHDLPPEGLLGLVRVCVCVCVCVCVYHWSWPVTPINGPPRKRSPRTVFCSIFAVFGPPRQLLTARSLLYHLPLNR